MVQQTFSGLNTDGLFTMAVSKFVLESLGNNSKAADLGYFKIIFFLILKMVYCVYSLELP